MIRQRALTLPIMLVLTSFVLTACSGNKTEGEDGFLKTEAKYPTGADRDGSTDSIYDKPASIFGDGGLVFGGKKDENDESTGIGVNSFLWRASLDTVSFMPLASADPFGGVILTDWYTPSEEATERYKLNVFILGKALRSDGVRVRVFSQSYRNGKWVDVPASKETARQIEDSILTRARQMRIAQIDTQK